MATTSFPLPTDATATALRAMTDLGSVEIFVAGGRGVYSGPLSYVACELGPCVLALAASPAPTQASAPTLLAAAAWPMRGIFSGR